MFFLVSSFLFFLFHLDKENYLGSTVINKKLLELLEITDKSVFKNPDTMRKYFGKVFTVRHETPELRTVGASCRQNESCLYILEYFIFLEAVSTPS